MDITCVRIYWVDLVNPWEFPSSCIWNGCLQLDLFILSRTLLWEHQRLICVQGDLLGVSSKCHLWWIYSETGDLWKADNLSCCPVSNKLLRNIWKSMFFIFYCLNILIEKVIWWIIVTIIINSDCDSWDQSHGFINVFLYTLPLSYTPSLKRIVNEGSFLWEPHNSRQLISYEANNFCRMYQRMKC